MDFTLDEDQIALGELAGRILAEQATPAALRALESAATPASPDVLADRAWAELARADLLGVALPEVDGGGGYGILEACLLAEQIGRHVAPVPYVASIVLGAMAVASHGTAAQRGALLPGAIAGTMVLSAALSEGGTEVAATAPATAAVPDGTGVHILTGEKRHVPWGTRADRILVPATTPDGRVVVAVVDPAAEGVTVEAEDVIGGASQAAVELRAVAVGPDDLLGGPDGDGPAIVAGLVERGIAATCATVAGVCEGAIRLTAAYVSEREQFGAKLGTFQAVGHRLADAYVDTEAVRLTMLQVAWRLATDRPAADELAIAKFWASEGGHRVVHAAQHLHGGVGVDVDYPIHRYYRWAKVAELTLGAATEHLRVLGAHLAAEPA